MIFRDNFYRLVKGNSPDWIPFTLDIGAIQGFTAPVLRRFFKETGSNEPEEYFNYDFRRFSLKAHFGGEDPKIYHPSFEPETRFDEWGVGHWAGGAEGTYEKMYPPLGVAFNIRAIESYPLPKIEVEVDPASLREYKSRGYPVFGYAGSIFEWSWWLRGMERFMIDLVEAPAMAERIIQKVAEYTKKLAMESAKKGIDVLCFYDDVGMQTGMQVSPKTWKKFIKPIWKDILDTVRSNYPNVTFFLHSCGNIREIMPDIVELGYNILHPVQPECIDLREAIRSFGNDIVLCATISSQRIFPFGSPEDIRREVRRLKRLFENNNRCILCPSNAIQPETPWENIIAFVEEAKDGRPVL